MVLPQAHALKASTVAASGKPYLLYGTAWKADQTESFVSQAIHAGFRFIDTACQPKHYNEQGVGLGWVHAAKELDLARDDFFLQTKFTPVSGQDPNRVPYQVEDELENQVRTSLQVSLQNLQTEYLDSLVLHSPMSELKDTIRVWRAFESFVDEGKVRQLGISNCYDLSTLRYLVEAVRIKPQVLQNRFYSDSGFDVELRDFCRENGILYQSFWTLTGNRRALASSEFQELAKSKGLTSQTLMYVFMMTLGHTPLSGTTDQKHMMQDVAVMERIQGGENILSDNEVVTISRMLGIEGV